MLLPWGMRRPRGEETRVALWSRWVGVGERMGSVEPFAPKWLLEGCLLERLTNDDARQASPRPCRPPHRPPRSILPTSCERLARCSTSPARNGSSSRLRPPTWSLGMERLEAEEGAPHHER